MKVTTFNILTGETREVEMTQAKSAVVLEVERLTRDEARALIAKHGIVALEREIGTRMDGSTYELDHNQYFRLGNGRLLWRQDSCDQECESWDLVVETIDGQATDATLLEIEAPRA